MIVSVNKCYLLNLMIVIIFLTLMSISNESEIPCRNLLGHCVPMYEVRNGWIRGEEQKKSGRRNSLSIPRRFWPITEIVPSFLQYAKR